MTCLLVRKKYCNIREARGYAKNCKFYHNDLSLKCKNVLIGDKPYYCFGPIPNEDILSDLDKQMGFFSDVFFLSS
jgi:hypothetical protein